MKTIIYGNQEGNKNSFFQKVVRISWMDLGGGTFMVNGWNILNPFFFIFYLKVAFFFIRKSVKDGSQFQIIIMVNYKDRPFEKW